MAEEEPKTEEKGKQEEEFSDIEIQAINELVNALVVNDFLIGTTEQGVYEVKGFPRADSAKVTTRIKEETEFPEEYRRLVSLIQIYAYVYSTVSGDVMSTPYQDFDSLARSVREVANSPGLNLSLASPLLESHIKEWTDIYVSLTGRLATMYTREQLGDHIKSIRLVLSQLLGNFVILIKVIFQYLDQELIFKNLTNQELKEMGISDAVSTEQGSRDLTTINLLIESRRDDIYSRQLLYVQNPTPAVYESISNRARTYRYIFTALVLEIDTGKVNEVISEAHSRLEGPSFMGGGPASAPLPEQNPRRIHVPSQQYTLLDAIYAIKSWFDNIQYLKSRFDEIRPFIENGRYNDALSQLELEIAQNPQFLDVWYSSKGYCYMKKKNYDQATEFFDNSLNENPYQLQVLNNKGISLLTISHFEEAIDCFNRVLEFDRSSVQALCYKGIALDLLGRSSEASSEYDETVKITKGGEFRDLALGLKLSIQGEYGQANLWYDGILKKDPDNSFILYKKGYALSMLGSRQEAFIFYKQATDSNPQLFNAWQQMGLELVELRNFDDALRCFDKAIEIRPNDYGALLNKATCLNKMERYSDAIVIYDKALKLKPENQEAWIWASRAEVLSKLGRAEETIESYDKALAFNPRNPSLWLSRGRDLFNLGKYNDAMRSLDRVLEIDPYNAEAYFLMAKCYAEIRDYSKGKEWLNRAIDIGNKYAPGTNYMDKAKQDSIAHQLLVSDVSITDRPSPKGKRLDTIPSSRSTTSQDRKRQILIIHGSDIQSKNELVEILFRLGLKPIILHEQPSEGRTIMETIEETLRKVSFAFIVLTRNDMSVRAAAKGTDSKLRENLTFEIGYLLSKLGRDRMCLITKERVNLPLNGFPVLVFRKSIREREFDIVKELRAAGFLA